MKNKLVSILIVSYNAEKYIEKTLSSCQNQTYQDLEILVLDNASNDETVKIIKDLDDSRIKLFEGKKNIGPYGGLNFLLEKAKGEYIAIQDHDDIWFPKKIEEQIDYLEKNKEEIACGTNTYYYYEDRGVLILDKRDQKISFVDHISLVFRNQGYRYDVNFLLTDEHFERIVLNGNKNKICCLSNPLTIHRIRKDRNNLSRVRFLFTKKNIRDYFFVRGISCRSGLDLVGIFIAKYFPPSLEWFLISKFVKAKSIRISLSNFRKTHQGIL